MRGRGSRTWHYQVDACEIESLVGKWNRPFMVEGFDLAIARMILGSMCM
jgi:hypothetical protein